MRFEEIEPNENYDLRRFRSLPLGLWEFGILKMLWANHRVRIAPAANNGFVPIDYWGGDVSRASLILGWTMGICSNLPESISAQELAGLLPAQVDKDISANFFGALDRAGETVRAKYKADGLS